MQSPHRVAAFVVIFAVMSCGSQPQPQRDALPNIEAEIRAVDDARQDALVRNDVAALSRLYADDFTMITSTGEVRTKADQLRDIGAGHVEHVAAPARILKLHIYGDVVVVHSEEEAGLVRDGQRDLVVRRFTRVYVKREGIWQLAATHISRVSSGK